jgi:hypothetical protein
LQKNCIFGCSFYANPHGDKLHFAAGVDNMLRDLGGLGRQAAATREGL